MSALVVAADARILPRVIFCARLMGLRFRGGSLRLNPSLTISEHHRTAWRGPIHPNGNERQGQRALWGKSAFCAHLDDCRSRRGRIANGDWDYLGLLLSVAALIQYVLDKDLATEEDYWHMTALKSAVAALNSMGRCGAVMNE
jgi:hypothetical protein